MTVRWGRNLNNTEGETGGPILPSPGRGRGWSPDAALDVMLLVLWGMEWERSECWLSEE